MVVPGPTADRLVVDATTVGLEHEIEKASTLPGARIETRFHDSLILYHYLENSIFLMHFPLSLSPYRLFDRTSVRVPLQICTGTPWVIVVLKVESDMVSVWNRRCRRSRSRELGHELGHRQFYLLPFYLLVERGAPA